MHEFIHRYRSENLENISKQVLLKYQEQEEDSVKRSDNLNGTVKEIAITDDEFINYLDKEIKPIVQTEINNFLDKTRLINVDQYYLNNYSIMHHSELYNIPLHYDAEYVYSEDAGDNVRNFAVLIYLNGDFQGGELIFPVQKETIKPESGLMVIFPTSFMFPHVTSPAIGNDRYVLRLNYIFKKESIKNTVRNSVTY